MEIQVTEISGGKGSRLKHVVGPLPTEFGDQLPRSFPMVGIIVQLVVVWHRQGPTRGSGNDASSLGIGRPFVAGLNGLHFRLP